MRLRNVALSIFAAAMASSAQPPAAPVTMDGPFHVAYAANLDVGESYVIFVNDGASGAPLNGSGLGGATGNICINVYAYDPNEEMISCCSCLVTPDQVRSLAVTADLTSNTATGVVPTSVTIMSIATLAGVGGSGTTCNNSAPLVDTLTLTFGKLEWTYTQQKPESGSGAGKVAAREKPATPAHLSPGELAQAARKCAAIVGNLSGFGICASCRTGALGAGKM